MPYIWTEPELVFTHKGVSVYHVYKNDFVGSGHYLYQYTTDVTEEAAPFDIRELENYRSGEDHDAILMRAIENGEITSLASEEGKHQDV